MGMDEIVRVAKAKAPIVAQPEAAAKERESWNGPMTQPPLSQIPIPRRS
jgi:hypothetical protein